MNNRYLMQGIILIFTSSFLLISFTSSPEIILGTSLSDTLNGTNSDDIILGYEGDDFLYGNDGNDIFSGGPGNDLISGGDGRDTADYSNAGDRVRVDLSIDDFQNTRSEGLDKLISIENLTGSNHNDLLSGNHLNNLIRGGLGTDNLFGGLGDDILDGGNGQDYANYRSAQSSVKVNLNITGFQNTGGEGYDKLISIEGIYGSEYNDVLIGNNQNNRIFGDSGNDIIVVGAGNDIIVGGAGYDTADYSNTLGPVNIRLGEQGQPGFNTRSSGWDQLSSIENIIGTHYDDSLGGDQGNNILNGLGGNNILFGAEGEDTYIWQKATSKNLVRERGGTDLIQLLYTDSTELLTFVQDAFYNFRIENEMGGNFYIEGQYSDETSPKVEYIQVGSESFISLNSSFEGLVTDNEFNNYRLETFLYTKRNITVGSTLKISDLGTIFNSHVFTNNGEVVFESNSTLDGEVVNNGIVTIADNKLLELSGNISGSGSFNGDTLLSNVEFKADYRPNTLTFNGDSTWDNVSFNVEIGLDMAGDLMFDQIDVFGNLTLNGLFDLNIVLLDNIDWSDLIGDTFKIISGSGAIKSENGFDIKLIDLVMVNTNGWNLNWDSDGESWSLIITATKEGPTNVPEPTTLLLILFFSVFLLLVHHQKYKIQLRI